MSWVCSRVWWDGWLHPVVKTALTPISCLVPLESPWGVTSGRRAWRGRQMGGSVPHCCAAFGACGRELCSIVMHGKFLGAKDIGHCFGLKCPAPTLFQK